MSWACVILTITIDWWRNVGPALGSTRGTAFCAVGMVTAPGVTTAMTRRAPSHLRRRRHCFGAPLGLATVRTDGPIGRRRRAELPLTP